MGHLKVCLPCNKLDIYGKNIKMPSNATMERDLENPTPTIDLEPKKKEASKSAKSHFEAP